MIKILPPGTDVTITQAGAIGKVSKVVIGYEGITYEVTYYLEGVRQVVPATEQELQVCVGVKKASVGFK
jgi:hypothetical protein